MNRIPLCVVTTLFWCTPSYILTSESFSGCIRPNPPWLSLILFLYFFSPFVSCLLWQHGNIRPLQIHSCSPSLTISRVSLFSSLAWVPCPSHQDSHFSLASPFASALGIHNRLDPHSFCSTGGKKKVKTSKATAADTAFSFLLVVFKRILVGFHSALTPCIILVPFPPETALVIYWARVFKRPLWTQPQLSLLGKGQLHPGNLYVATEGIRDEELNQRSFSWL